MGKFNDFVNAVNVVKGASDIKDNIQIIKESNLTEEEKQKALSSHKKMMGVTLAVVLIICIGAGIITAISFMHSLELGILVVSIAIPIVVIVIIFYAVTGRNKFSDYRQSQDKIAYDFDGLTEEEMASLGSNDKEKKLIVKNYIVSAFWTIIMLAVIIIAVAVVPRSGNKFLIVVGFIIAIIIAFICLAKDESCGVEITRLKSGYYRKGAKFTCNDCKKEIRINFEKFPEYDLLPRNEINARVMQCPYCNGKVVLLAYDNYYKQYKKYMKEMQK